MLAKDRQKRKNTQKKKKKFKNKDNIAIKKINIGIQILRALSCFVVILMHFYGFHNLVIIKHNYFYSLIFFYIISFYFSYNTLASFYIPKIKARFIRMVIPYIGWPLIFYLRDKFYHHYYKYKELYTKKNLYYQILTGCGMYGIFWFLFNLIFLSLFFTIIIFLFKRCYTFSLFLITAFLYYFCNSNYAYILIFNHFRKIPVNHSIKPVFTFFIYPFTGFYLAHIQFINKLYKFRIRSIIISAFCAFLYLKFYYSFFTKINKFYKDIRKTFFSVSVFALFSMIPFDKIDNNYIYIFLSKITSYTGGIYYLHVKMGDFCREHITINRHNTFKGCLLIYLFCYLICFVATFILKKSNLKYLFI